MLTAGWELRGEPGHVVHLSRTTGNFTSMVDIFIEPYVWTYWNKDFGWGNRVGDMGILGSPTAGTYLPDDDLPAARELGRRLAWRSEEHKSELQSLMRISYAVFCLKKKKKKEEQHT